MNLTSFSGEGAWAFLSALLRGRHLNCLRKGQAKLAAPSRIEPKILLLAPGLCLAKIKNENGQIFC